MLALPPGLGFGVAFPAAAKRASARVVLGSAAIAAVNGTLEEALWRGTYQAAFPESAAGDIYPAVAFALWHYAPQRVFPNPRPGGATSLVVVGGLTGLLWGRVARESGSLLWPALSHALFDFSGLGARLYQRGEP